MPPPRFPAVRETNTALLVAFVIADYVLVALVILLYASGALTSVAEATGNLINRALLGNLVLLVLVVGVLILRIGRLRARDIGLAWPKLPVGIAVTAALWTLVQVLQLISSLVLEGSLEVSPEWSQVGVPAVVGALLGQLFGNALYEDLAYRGFLFPQFVVKLERRWPRSTGRALVAALLVPQTLFALRHIPSDLLAQVNPAGIALDVVRLVAVGVILALLYLRTRNLFVVIGIHAVINAPTALFAPSFIGPSNLAFVLAIGLLFAWPPTMGDR